MVAAELSLSPHIPRTFFMELVNERMFLKHDHEIFADFLPANTTFLDILLYTSSLLTLLSWTSCCTLPPCQHFLPGHPAVHILPANTTFLDILLYTSSLPTLPSWTSCCILPPCQHYSWTSCCILPPCQHYLPGHRAVHFLPANTTFLDILLYTSTLPTLPSWTSCCTLPPGQHYLPGHRAVHFLPANTTFLDILLYTSSLLTLLSWTSCCTLPPCQHYLPGHPAVYFHPAWFCNSEYLGSFPEI